ncbi:MAG TPA: PKD domain-containing protein, partial [Telluria sp.]|nr:PKD domain-containing protein [Telluria sp.]
MRTAILALFICFHLTASAGINTGLVGDDRAAGPFPIGFAFKYYGNTYTQFYVTTNGLVQFVSPTSAYNNGCLPSLSNTILAFWDDLRTDVSGQPSGKIEYQTIGQASERKLVVQWTNQFFFGSNLPMGTFQVVLSEGSNEVKLQYRYLREAQSMGGSATIGIQGSTSQFMQVGCNQANVIRAEQAITFTPDASGLVYQMDKAAVYDFIDISGLTPEPPIPAARFVNAAPTWNWARIPELTMYQVEIQTDAGELVHTETLGNVSSYAWSTGFQAGKTYRARVRGSVNNGGTWELWSGLSQAVTVDQVIPTGQMLSAVQVGPTAVEWRYSAADDLSGVDTIRLQAASDADFQNLVLDEVRPAATTSFTYAAAVPGQRLYARIKVVDKAGNAAADSNTVEVLVLPPPSAAFSPSTAAGEAPLDVIFQNGTTGSATSYLWNFGDGRTSTAANPSLRYREPGTYEVVLRATGVGGYTEASRTISVTPDVTLPTIGPVAVGGLPVGATLSLLQNTLLSFTVADANDVQSVTATLSGQPVAVTSLGGGNYRLALDPLQFDNGTYTLLITGRDSVGNQAATQLEVVINLPPPAAPVLTAPAASLRTNQPVLTVSGTTPSGTEAQLLLNGTAQGEWIAVVAGRFTASLTLAEGPNRVAAMVRNNRGASTPGAEVVVTLNTTKPNGPSGLTAASQAQGKIRVTWTPSTDAASLGTVVFRSASPFDTVAQAARLTANPLAVNSFDDIPPADGSYYYRVASINDLGTLSTLSNSAQGLADASAPKALSIAYTSLGRTDPATGRIGQGRVDLVATVSEPLLVPPYLSIVPQGGTPIPVELAKTGNTTYAGSFLIDANTPSGIAHALFSARDAVGNRGTEIDAGATLTIETAGPVLSGIVLNPVAPIKNDTAQTITAVFTFNKAPAAPPQVKYLLSGPVRTPVALGSLAQVNPTTYSASFTLPADAGLGSPESLSFSVQAQDDLDNVSTKVSAFNRFQVYQGALPPLNVPFGFSAKAQPGGKVRMTWQAVDEAASYQLYRQAPGQDSLQALTRTGGLEYIDQTPQDGLYKYAIATVRASNGQESVSGQSAAIDVTAIANGPGAPQNLALQLTGQGIYATWQAPLASTVDYYNLYRASGTGITSIDGLTPLKTRIKNPVTYDTSPSPSQGAYVVTAVDAAGNESAISNSAYLNASLLPVRQLKVEQLGNTLPVISWTAPNGNVAGYLVYVGPDSARVKLTASAISATTLTDTGYTAGERRYTVASVDANGVELARSVVLPRVGTQIAAGLPIKRGMMNKLQVQVANTSASALAEVRVVVRLPIDRDSTQFKDHRSEPFALAPNETRLVPVIVGGYADLPGAPLAQVGVEIVPDEDGLVKIAGTQTVDVTEGALVVGMATDEFTRGGTGKLKLTIENTGEVDVELLTATANGAGNSSELRFKLLDADGNVLATQPYKQVFGANVVTLTNGLTVARIAAGTSYVSDVFELNVPGSSPNAIRVKLEVDKLRYHSGQADEVQIAGRGSERSVSLVDTAYVGEVTEVAPINSFGDQDVVITGRALDRVGRAPLANTRLKLVFNQQGFERSFAVLTDGSGNFAYTFKPTLTDAGLYKVSAVHPSITDRPEQKAFTINRVTVGPTPFRIDVPKNYPFTVPFTAKAGAGTSATNLRLTLDAASQPTGQIPAGINVELPAPVTLAERQTLNVPVVFSANNDAQPSGSLIFNIVSDEHAGTPLGQVTLSYQLSEAKPFLVSTPSFVETGLAQGSTQVETVVLKNNGMQEALNLRFALTKADGSPAPGWAGVASQADGTLGIGASRPVDLSFMPPADLAAGVYEFKLNIEGDNLPPQAVNVYVSLSQSGQGNVLFKAADIYTATVGKDGNLVAGLAGATITLQNEDVPTISHELVTDSLGEALFQNVPAGSYKFRARATNHQEAGGRLLIKPGITANQSLFLDYNLITVEWSVREISIQDRYEITLNATYETDVPAAVVVMQPTSVNLPKMNVGDVYYGELTLTNYGLVRADNVRQQLPASDGLFRYEFLVDVPPALAPKQRITVPYRV